MLQRELLVCLIPVDDTSLVKATMFKKLIKSVLPRQIMATGHSYRTLSSEFGQYKSMQRWECIDASDSPIPWYTYPAIEYLKQLDFSDKLVFEYGSGNSTRFWAGRCKKIVSVEDSREWYEKIGGKLPANSEYLLLEAKNDYTGSINNYSDDFDIVIVDGSHRYECALEALGKLKNDGFIILDNSDWFENTSKLLRDADLIEVDMSGFGPINSYTWTTSFFFRRNVKLTTAYDRQPIPCLGGVVKSESGQETETDDN